MMTDKCYVVNWAYTDERGVIVCWNIKWFDTLMNAEDWIYQMQKSNGSYFQCMPPRVGNYERWLELLPLQDRLEELQKEFYYKI